MYEANKDTLFCKGSVFYYKKGIMIAVKDGKTDEVKFFHGGLCDLWLELTGNDGYNKYTRAEGWRIWRKHFSDLPYYVLPEYVQELLDLPCSSYGKYYSKKYKEWIGYAG